MFACRSWDAFNLFIVFATSHTHYPYEKLGVTSHKKEKRRPKKIPCCWRGMLKNVEVFDANVRA